MSRTVVWFSCGAASAVAAQLAVGKYGDDVEIVYCDTSDTEHPDNMRFLKDVEDWIGYPISRIKSTRFSNVEEVWEARKYMAGIKGASCTVEMKKVPRFEYQRVDDIHVFGLTADENKRIVNFIKNNPELNLDWILRDMGVTKQDCFKILKASGIRLPILYSYGFKNNNCIGCVKATSPKYWAMVRDNFPEIYKRRAEQSRRLGARLTRIKDKNGKWVRIFLDELPEGDFSKYRQENISCGPDCKGEEG